MRPWVLLGAAALLACGGASEPRDEAADETSAEGEALSETARTGPVRAKVSLTPAEPQLGDTLRLELRVQAEPGVDVEMPEFGEALGRFRIVDFQPREERGEGDRRIAIQTYRLQAAASGRQRIPPLRVTFEDRRPSRPDAPEGDAAAPRELLTPELSVDIASVLPEDEDGELRPPRGALDPQVGPSWLARHIWIALGAALGAATAVALGLRARRRRRAGPVESPYQRARRRLDELEARGEPDADALDEEAIDAWYVALSSIVRRYLEDRFSLRAPELTTEEFLRVAQRSDHLRPEHRELLAEFLAGCDRVKFAGYRPAAKESAQALETARRFVDDTRPRGEDEKEAAA